MAALAGIGAMPDTITDRAINLTMRRRTRGERVAQFRSRRDGPLLAMLHDRLARWAAGVMGDLAEAEPHMPVEDRAADTWEPLIAIADVAGGSWPKRARAACTALVDDAEDTDAEDSLATKLLVDIKRVFAEQSAPFLSSADLVSELRRIEESPWDDFDMNPRKLAYRLKDFGITPGHNTSKTARGYTLEALSDAFARYTRPEPSTTSETHAELQQPWDGKNAPDGSIRPDVSTRPDEIAGQQPFRTSRTVADAPPARNSFCPGCGTYFATHGSHRPDCTARKDAVEAAKSRLDGCAS
jgi:hypothetical protein